MATSTTPTSTVLPPLTTAYTPPAECSISWLLTLHPAPPTLIVPSGNSTKTWAQTTDTLLVRNTLFGSSSVKCRPSGTLFSPGLICPEGWTVARTAMTTYYGRSVDRHPVTWMPCCPSGYDYARSRCWVTLEPPVVAMVTLPSGAAGPVTTITTAGSTIVRTLDVSVVTETTITAPIVAYQTPMSLGYRQADIPPGFSVKEGATVRSPAPWTHPPLNTEHDYHWNADSALVAGIAILAVGVVVGIGLLARKMMFGSGKHGRREKKTSKKDGRRGVLGRSSWLGLLGLLGQVAPAVPAAAAVLVGAFAVVLAKRTAWQEELVVRFEDTSAVLRVMQALAFVMRTCAVILAWGSVADTAWLLMTRGTAAVELVNLLDLAVIGGGYSSLAQTIWSQVRKTSLLHLGLMLYLLLAVVASDLVGVGMLASIGIGETSAGTLQTSTEIPFTSIRNDEITVTGDTTGTTAGTYYDQTEHILTSSANYPHILRSGNQLAFLPVQAGDKVPSAYSGVGLFGNYTSECRPVSFTGQIWATNSEVGAVGSISHPFEERPVSSTLNMTIRPAMASSDENKLNLKLQESTVSVMYLPWKNSTQSFSYEDLMDPVHLFVTLRIAAPAEITVPSHQYAYADAYANVSAANKGILTLPYLPGSVEPNNGPGLAWKMHICRVELPFAVGLVTAPSISAIKTPVISCPSSSYSSSSSSSSSSLSNGTEGILCPRNLTTNAAPGLRLAPCGIEESKEKLLASTVDRHSLWAALYPFCARPSSRLVEARYGGIIYCALCDAGRIAGKAFSSAVVAANDDDDDGSFSAAFGASILHAVAATYRSDLQLNRGVGPAEWTVARAASLVTAPAWVWVAVMWTWMLALVALVLRASMLARVGLNRTGSVIAGAAVAVNGPLAKVVERAGVMEREQVVEAVEDEGYLCLGENEAGDAAILSVGGPGMVGSQNGGYSSVDPEAT